MSKTPLTRREREIMDILYRRGRATAQEVLDDSDDPPSYSAVRALLRLLEEHGHARHTQEGQKYVYAPAVARGDARRSALAHVVRTFFAGSVEQAVATLVDPSRTKLSREELDRLSEVIERAKSEGTLMDAGVLLSLAVRGALVLGASLVVTRLASRAPSSTRRLVLALGLAGALTVPLATAVVPRLEVAAPVVAAPMLRARVFAEGDPGDPAPSAVVASVSSISTTAPSRPFSWRGAIVGLWALGAAVVIARLVAGLVRARAMVRRARPVTSLAWTRSLERASRAIGVTAALVETDELEVPAVTGVLFPVVLVPANARDWDEERRVAVLLHELAHVRQHDCFAHIVGQLACALHWFDPLAWRAASRLRVERELAADDAVLGAGACASSYAESLLAIAGVHVGWRAVPTLALGISDGRELAARVVAIVSPDRPRARPSPITTGGAVLVATLLVMGAAGASPRAVVHASIPARPTGGVVDTTIDPRAQAIADDELDRAIAESGARGGTVLVLDPRTGAILAESGRLDGASADVAAGVAVVPGSTFKVVTLAAALDEGVVAPSDRIDCRARQYGDLELHDAAPNGMMTVAEALTVSSNVGTSRVLDRLGDDRLVAWMSRFHLDAPPMPSTATGVLPSCVEPGTFAGATAAMGVSVTTTPLQIASVYATLANGGEYVAPTRVHRDRPETDRVVSPTTARTMLSLLGEVVSSERGTGRRARVPGVAIAGKTGTADWDEPSGKTRRWASFVGVAPADRPRFVVLVGVDTPADEEANGGSVAAPAFARVVTRLLER